ncbi:PDZ domain-containing protein [Neorhodopirellula lusitana]|uniref:PDZ domain-containing protein n=1 Tax=Neorhodopirellula lusitana TaxID=445327 RepID=A0ABY1QC89_9BACT|nr:PDZ domain-containing protein [Neorhodopirellula lusitana]SMP65475.1 PDZ domain-containing protein [Neorhodopirellula lusitana]
MPQFLSRRSIPLSKVGLGLLITLAVLHCVDSPSASAQGLFSRLRARAESRRAAFQAPPVAQPNQLQRNQSQPNQFRGTNSQNPNSRDQNANSKDPRVLAKPLPSPSRAGQSKNQNQANAPTLGIEVSPTQVGPYRGLGIVGFSEDSLATRSGLRPGDVIVAIEGVRTATLADVTQAQSRSQVGQQATIELYRGGRRYRAMVPFIKAASNSDPDDALASKDSSDKDSADKSDRELDQRKRGEPRMAAKPPVSSTTGPTLARPRASLGVEVRNATPKRGVEIATAGKDTAGTIGGFRPLDRIVSVEGRLISDTDDLIRELSLSQPGDRVQFGVVRNASMLELDVEMGGPGGKPIRSATSPVGSQAKDSKEEASDSGNSLLSGMGSALGGFFSSTKPAPETKELPAPTAQPTPAPAPAMEQLHEPSDREAILPDPLALPEDTASDQTGFGASELPSPRS